VAFEAFGPARMFGSDFPVCLLAASHADVKHVIDDYCAALSEPERAGVLANNAIAFYRLAASPAR
jgi:L-fuconolactonase